MSQSILVTGSTIVALFMASLMVFVRIKAAKQPTNAKKIILPPFFMSTGALMFLFSEFRLTNIEILEAVLLGVIFSILLIRNTKFEIKNNNIYVIPSKSFIFILLGLLVLRIIIKLLIGTTISFGETSGMFFLLAFTMILCWRVSMLRSYSQLKRKLV